MPDEQPSLPSNAQVIPPSPKTGHVLKHHPAVARLFNEGVGIRRLFTARGLSFFLSYFPVSLVFASELWVLWTFGNPSADQIWFHLQMGKDYSAGTPLAMVAKYLLFVGTGCLLILLVAAFMEARIRFPQGADPEGKVRAACRKVIGAIGPSLLLTASIFLAISQFRVQDLFAGTQDNSFIEKHYLAPQAALAPGKTPRNLVLIYIESLDKAFREPRLFNRNLLAALDGIPGASFEQFSQVEGTGWTIGGIASSQCGIPVKTLGMADGNQQGELFSNFLPGATCLGDSLAKLGYTSVFLGGASATFAGKGKFLKSHGYTRVLGREDWLNSGRYSKHQMSGWGLYDDDLFKEAARQMDELSAIGKPFNLTILTVDTHFPKGELSRTCKQRGLTSYEGIVECTAQLTAEFIRQAQEKGQLRNTNVVILGDHLSMPSVVIDKLKSVEQRFIYNRWISSDTPIKVTDSIVHFDIAPSILNFLGIRLEKDRYGLGYNSFEPTTAIPEPGRLQAYAANLGKPSSFYRNFWQPPNP